MALDEKPMEINSTVSTKLSTDQLICKSPPSSVELGQDDTRRQSSGENEPGGTNPVKETPLALYLGVLQILFGMLMAVCGVLVLMHDSSLAQTGGGLWGGCLAAITGVMGVFSVARDCCPLKDGFQRACHTAFLALSLVSLAVAHLVLVISSIGLARDTTSNEFGTELPEEDQTPPLTYETILANVGLLLVSACECVAAAMSAYQAARTLCPCFRRGPGSKMGEDSEQPGFLDNKHMLVTNWLGKQSGQPLYAVVPATKVPKGMPKMMAPVFTVSPTPSILPPSVMGYPLIPAPLGTTPPPILAHRHHLHVPHMRNEHKIHRKRKRLTAERNPRLSREEKSKKKSRRKDKKRQITEEEVARTYTGLDRVIAEEFIEICDRHCVSDTSASGTSSDSASNEGCRK